MQKVPSFWDGYEDLSAALDLFDTLPILRKTKTTGVGNGKWYCTDPIHKVSTSICLGCALFKREIKAALPRCPLSLCYERDCITTAHPSFQSIQCHVKHHRELTVQDIALSHEVNEEERDESSITAEDIYFAGETLAGNSSYR